MPPAPEKDPTEDPWSSSEFFEDDVGKFAELSREKNLSKTKKVKNYLKKCKNTANNYIQNKNGGGAGDSEEKPVRKAAEDSVPHTSWYVTDEFYLEEEAESHVTVVQITDEARNTTQTEECDGVASVHSANVEVDVGVARICELGPPPEPPPLPPPLPPPPLLPILPPARTNSLQDDELNNNVREEKTSRRRDEDSLRDFLNNTVVGEESWMNYHTQVCICGLVKFIVR